MKPKEQGIQHLGWHYDPLMSPWAISRSVVAELESAFAHARKGSSLPLQGTQQEERSPKNAFFPLSSEENAVLLLERLFEAKYKSWLQRYHYAEQMRMSF